MLLFNCRRDAHHCGMSTDFGRLPFLRDVYYYGHYCYFTVVHVPALLGCDIEANSAHISSGSDSFLKIYMPFKLSIDDLSAVTSHISCVSNVLLLLPMLGNFYQKAIPRHARHVRLLTNYDRIYYRIYSIADVDVPRKMILIE